MRYAIISDIHSNLHALEVVVSDIKDSSVDRVLCLGDVVGYGAYPNESLAITREISHTILAGNHDHAAIGLMDISAFNHYANKAAIWTRNKLTEENTSFMRECPFIYEEGSLLFVHATPEDPAKWSYVFSDIDAQFVLQHNPGRTIFIGHTHIPREHSTKDGRLINVGSVGQPRDGDPRASYGIFDGESGILEIKRLEYDIDAAKKAILDAGLPPFLAERLSLGR